MFKIFFNAVFLLATGCHYMGTGTGNPNQPLAGSSPATAAMRIRENICGKLISCGTGASDADCQPALANSKSFAPKLGLNLNPPPSLNEISMLEQEGTIQVNDLNEAACHKQILELSCQDSKITDAYRPNEADPFAESPELLQPVCAQIYN